MSPTGWLHFLDSFLVEAGWSSSQETVLLICWGPGFKLSDLLFTGHVFGCPGFNSLAALCL